MKQFASVVAGACAAFSVIVATTTPIKAQVPRQISYQGVLTDAITGKPFTGKHVVTIKLYDAPLATKPLWVEEHLAPIENGLFNLSLGANVPLTLAFDRPYFIGVSVDGKPEISRVPLASAPYALQAAEAQSLAPTATGAVLSLNGEAGDLSLIGSNGIKIENDGGLFHVEFDAKSLKKGEGILVPPDGPAGGDLSGNYPNPIIGTAKITTTKLADNIISTSKVIDGAITSAKIANGTITSTDIATGAITTDDIASGGVRSSNILDGTITTADLANGAVQTQIIATDAVRTDKIMDLNVTEPKLANNAVTTLKLANLAVTGAKMADGAVTTQKIANDAVTGAKLADNSVASTHIINGGIQSVDLADNSVITPKILDRNVTGRKLWTYGAEEGYVITFNGSEAVWGPGSGGSVSTVPTPVCQNAFVRFNNTAGTQITQGALILEDVTEDNIVPIRANICSEEGGRLGIALVTRDGGALQASSWGNTRGYNAIDWQMERYDDYEVAGGDYSVIGGGIYNAIIPGGDGESVGGYAAVIGGGSDNYIEGSGTDYAVIGGGNYNYINANSSDGDGSTISGGLDNGIIGDYTRGSFIGGGQFNGIGEGINFEGFGGSWSVITGGTNNAIGNVGEFGPSRDGADGPIAFAFIGGGGGNGIFSAGGQGPGDYSHFSAIVGGESNGILEVSHHSFIGGGGYNVIANEGESFFSTIGGGHQNSISSNYGFIGGGQGNSVSGEGAIVVGGGYIFDLEGVEYHGNSAAGDFSFIGGGADNEVGFDAGYSSVIGGRNNIIGGNETNSRYSVILGGRGLTTYGDGSLGFLGGNTDGSHDMEVTASNAALLGNVDVWLANNDNDARELRFYTPNNISSGVFPHSEVGYTGFVAPNTIENGAGYQMYSLPQDVPGVGQVLKVSSIGGGDVALEWANDNTPTLQYFAESQSTTAPNNTRYVSTWSAIGGASDIDIALSPKGSGALTAQTADDATSGGEKRGIQSVDWQMLRGAPDQVAAGENSVIAGGSSNRVDGNFSAVLGGAGNSIFFDAENAAILGGSGNSIGGDESGSNYSAILGGNGLSLIGEGSVGFLANHPDGGGGYDRNMDIDAGHTAVFGNVDMWLASNDGTNRELRFYAQHDASGTFPGTTKYTGFVAPNTLPATNNVVYTLPATEPTNGQFLRAVNVNSGGGGGTTTVDLEWANNSSGGALVYSTNDTYTSSPFNGNVNDLSISGTATYFRVDATTNIDLTGIDATGTTDGRVIYITNIGTNFISLKDDDSNSSSSNQFRLADNNDVLIGPDITVGLIYDGSVSRWRVLTY